MEMNSIVLACIAVLHGGDPWLPASGSMDRISTFTFSQSSIGDAADPQIPAVAANLNIRTFSSWQNGTSVQNSVESGRAIRLKAATPIRTKAAT
jgi:hypothetical protein